MNNKSKLFDPNTLSRIEASLCKSARTATNGHKAAMYWTAWERARSYYCVVDREDEVYAINSAVSKNVFHWEDQLPLINCRNWYRYSK